MRISENMKVSALAAAVASALPGLAWGQSAARVDFAVGNPTATAPDGRRRTLARGSEIAEGELINTGAGRLQLRFADGQQMALQPDTDFRIESYRFQERGGGQDNVVMNLIKGGMRTITGLIGRSNRNAYTLKTSTATIGIRGTEFTAEMGDALRAFCVQGLIFLGNNGGGLLLASGQGAFVQNFTTPPQRDDTRPALPTISKQEMEVLLALAGVDPKNPAQDFNPVVTLQTALAQVSNTRITGTQNGNWAVSLGRLKQSSGVVTGQPITLDNSGNLTKFEDGSAGYSTLINTSTVTSGGNDGIVAWGKWTGGATSGVNPAFSGKDLSAQGPLHYVVGIPLSSKPTTGVGTYTMLGYTGSCFGNGCTTATVDDSKLSVDFGQSTVKLDMKLTVDGTSAGQYTYSGNSATLNGSGAFTLTGSFTGPGTTTGNTFQGSGFLAGSGALRAGLAWSGLVADGNVYVGGSNAYTRSSYDSAATLFTGMTGSQTGNWALAHNNQSTSQMGRTMSFNTSGGLTQVDGASTVAVTQGTASVTSSGNDGTIAWGAWTNGTTGGTLLNYGAANLTANGAMHYVAGLPATSIPNTGSATYNLLGSNVSCAGGGCTTATVNSSTLSVNFGTSTVSMAMNFTVNGGSAGTYSFSAGTASLASNGSFSGAGSLTGGVTSGSYSGSGFLSGAGATRAGLAWNGSITGGTTFQGVAAYQK